MMFNSCIAFRIQAALAVRIHRLTDEAMRFLSQKYQVSIYPNALPQTLRLTYRRNIEQSTLGVLS